jgi:hypothetical protein
MKKHTKKPLCKWLDVELFFAPELFRMQKNSRLSNATKTAFSKAIGQ